MSDNKIATEASIKDFVEGTDQRLKPDRQEEIVLAYLILQQLKAGITTTVDGTVAVTGTFFQATQPVSIASMPSTPVTGTFYPTTQEVSQDPLATWVSGSLTLTNATTAYLIPASEQAGRRQLILYNGSDTNMFIGSSAVTVATGILLATGATMMIDAGAGLYAICASAGKVLNYLEGK